MFFRLNTQALRTRLFRQGREKGTERGQGRAAERKKRRVVVERKKNKLEALLGDMVWAGDEGKVNFLQHYGREAGTKWQTMKEKCAMWTLLKASQVFAPKDVMKLVNLHLWRHKVCHMTSQNWTHRAINCLVFHQKNFSLLIKNASQISLYNYLKWMKKKNWPQFVNTWPVFEVTWL